MSVFMYPSFVCFYHWGLYSLYAAVGYWRATTVQKYVGEILSGSDSNSVSWKRGRRGPVSVGRELMAGQ